jgi:glutamate transport system permease protein
MSEQAVLYDAAGPRTRRLTLIGSAAAGVLLLAGLYWVVRRLQSKGQFESALWQPFTDPDIQHSILMGAVATLEAAALAIVCAMALGALLATGRLSEHRAVRVPCTVVIELFRALPLLLLILALFLAFPQTLHAFGALVLGLTLYNGSVLAEVFRAGILAVPRGQSEAAYALGMRKTQVMTSILMPQAVRMMLPAMISQCVVALKDTALGFVITFPEMLTTGKAIYGTYFNIIPTAIVIGTIYVGMNVILSTIAQRLQRRRRAKGEPTAPAAPAEDVLHDAVPV